MPLPAIRQDLMINKRSEFYLEASVKESVSLEGKTLFGIVKESHMSNTAILTLTEENGRLVRISETAGTFAIYLKASDTGIRIDNSVYEICLIDVVDLTKITRVMEGKICFSEGA